MMVTVNGTNTQIVFGPSSDDVKRVKLDDIEALHQGCTATIEDHRYYGERLDKRWNKFRRMVEVIAATNPHYACMALNYFIGDAQGMVRTLDATNRGE